jgi:hypothetical protein
MEHPGNLHTWVSPPPPHTLLYSIPALACKKPLPLCRLTHCQRSTITLSNLDILFNFFPKVFSLSYHFSHPSYPSAMLTTSSPLSGLSVLSSSAISSPFLGHQFSLPGPSVLPASAISSPFFGRQFSLPRPLVFSSSAVSSPFLPWPSVLPSSAVSSPFLGHQFSLLPWPSVLPSSAVSSPFLGHQFSLPRPSVLPSLVIHVSLQRTLPPLATSSCFSLSVLSQSNNFSGRTFSISLFLRHYLTLPWLLDFFS